VHPQIVIVERRALSAVVVVVRAPGDQTDEMNR
jgi:hypothetical protein